jgi:hypothetical protein
MRKCTVLLFITCLVASSLLVVLPASLAQTTKPSTPIFTIEYPAIIEVHSGGLYLNITNQPFTPYTDDGSEINLYYEAQIRKQGWVDTSWTPVINTRPYIEQSDTQYTIIDLPISQNLDVRVRALLGTVIHNPNNPDAAFTAWYEFKGVENDWSDIQVVTINWPTSAPSNTSPANTDTPMPSQLESGFDGKVKWTIGGFVLLTVIMFVVLVVMVIVMVILLLRKRAKV